MKTTRKEKRAQKKRAKEEIIQSIDINCTEKMRRIIC
jgi:hypothetical protein